MRMTRVLYLKNPTPPGAAQAAELDSINRRRGSDRGNPEGAGGEEKGPKRCLVLGGKG